MSTRSMRYDDVEVGDELPLLEIPITRTLIVATAIASRDYQDVHHDPALANEKGSQDIFMNILTTNGLVGRYVTDWAGPDAVLRSVKIRLGAPNYPGDTMLMTGSVTAKADGVIEIGLRGANRLGDHVTGTVTLALPDPSARGRDGATRRRNEQPTKQAKKQAKKQTKKAKKQAKRAKKQAKKPSTKGATT